MSPQYQDMYQEYPLNRSPGSTRGYNGLSLNRQTSRHFENYSGPLQGLYTAEDHAAAARFDPGPRFDRMPMPNLQTNYAYDAQTWNYGGSNGGANTIIGAPGRVKATARRTGLPTTWLEPQMPPMPNLGLHMNNQFSQPIQQPQQHTRISPPPDHEELIPTAVVIKNIPFAVKKEALVTLMTEMNLPLPYAFNYHFDNGVFRGLAFANFTTPEETSQVIDAMNHMDLQGRKLRVEYKKMLPAAERDRIEREKRERRGQLQEQHQPMSANQLHNQASITSMNSTNHPATSPSPVSMRNEAKMNVDLNNPATLNFYTQLLMFKQDVSRETLIFSSSVTPAERRTIHTLAHHMGLEHRSEGSGDMRQVQILKSRPNLSPPLQQVPAGYFNESQRRGLNRAATIDFSEARGAESGYYSHTLGRQGSGLLNIPDSPGMGMSAQNLRAAKSFADLRSYTPSPVPSSASFPANLTQNISRYADFSLASGPTATPNLTPTSAGGNNRDDSFLINGMTNMTIGHERSNASRPAGSRLQEREIHQPSAGAIGSQRLISNGNFEDVPRNGASVIPERQPRGPGAEWGTGFSTRPRQNGHVTRGSGELDLESVKKSWEEGARNQEISNGQQPASRFM